MTFAKRISGAQGDGIERNKLGGDLAKDVEERLQQRAGEWGIFNEEGDGGGPMINDVQATDGSGVNGSPSDEMIPRFPIPSNQMRIARGDTSERHDSATQ